jgi:putative ABC transport system substrate-binding protein
MRRREFIAVVGSAAVAWPLAARAQQSRLPLVGILRISPKDGEIFLGPFRRYMKAIGWEEGRNVRFLPAFTEGRNDRARSLAGELVGQNVDVIIAFGNPLIQASQRATETIPIVGMADDMVGSGLADSMARPGRNTTGVSILAAELDVKRFEILHEFVPQAHRIGVLADPTSIATRAKLTSAARDLEVELVVLEAQSQEEVSRSLDAIPAANVGAVNVLASPLLFAARLLIMERMRAMRTPAIYQWPETAEEGGLLAYGPRLLLCYRHVVGLVDKVLRGAKPAELPIEQPSKFELVVNLNTASSIGLTIPSTLLLRSDEVID